MDQHDTTKVNSQKGPDRYQVEVLRKALDVIDVLRKSRTALRLTDIAEEADLDISTAFRLLRTLEGRGYVLRDQKTKRFKQSLGYRVYRVGYAQLSSDVPFSCKVTQSLIDCAAKFGVELLVTDNHDSPEEAVKCATRLIEEKVDFVIEYQFHYRVAPVLSNMFHKAGIPVLAIDIPMPNAIYFGANNYAAGTMGGEALARYAKEKWHGRADRVLLLEIPEAGQLPHSRVVGTLDGLQRVLPRLNQKSVVHMNGRGTEMGAYTATRRLIRRLGQGERLLIAAATDQYARGAIRAIREARRERCTAIMAQGWGPDEALDAELQTSGSPLTGAVAYYPNNYGPKILPIVLQCLNGQPVPPAVYIEHKLITRNDLLSSLPVKVSRESLSAEASEASVA